MCTNVQKCTQNLISRTLTTWGQNRKESARNAEMRNWMPTATSPRVSPQWSTDYVELFNMKVNLNVFCTFCLCIFLCDARKESNTSLHTSDNFYSNPQFSHAIPTSSTAPLHVLSSCSFFWELDVSMLCMSFSTLDTSLRGRQNWKTVDFPSALIPMVQETIH